MSTSALITLHNLDNGYNGKSSMSTVTFYRHWDGDMDRTMAAFFFAAMDNPHKAKGGYFDAFMCANPSEVEYMDMLEYSIDDCCCEYHYHFNAETLQLIVNHEPYEETQRRVFAGTIDEFINKYSGQQKTIVSYDQYAPERKKCLTIDGMIRTVAECFDKIERLNQPLNPNHKSWLKIIDRFLIILDEMNLSPEARAWRSQSMQLSTGYSRQMMIAEERQRLQNAIDEANTTTTSSGIKITLLK